MGPNPTDRGKNGTKRHHLTDAEGIPLSVTLSPANRHDMKMFGATLDGIVIERPSPHGRIEQNLGCDKGYDYPALRLSAKRRGYIPHIKERGTGNEPCKAGRRHPARRWVVERTGRWHNLFRRLKIRYERKAENYLAFVHFANAIICFRSAITRS